MSKVLKQVKNIVASMLGFEVFVIMGNKSASHYCFTRTEALAWMACYGTVANEVHMYRHGVLVAQRFPNWSWK
jgi:predicted NAD/FAD-dependent oxidoreductase